MFIRLFYFVVSLSMVFSLQPRLTYVLELCFFWVLSRMPVEGISLYYYLIPFFFCHYPRCELTTLLCVTNLILGYTFGTRTYSFLSMNVCLEDFH